MKAFQPKALHALLEELGVHAKKHLSQNFLIDGNIVNKIVATAGVSKEDLVIEIGPGPGALTEALLLAGAEVIAIEKDPLLGKALGRLPYPLLRILIEDICTVDIPGLLQKKKAKVVSNLPYHLTSPILGKLLPLHTHISTLTVMVQKEVAERLCAQAGTPNYSSLTLFANTFADLSYSFTVEPTCFFPRPKVRSAVIHFTLKPPPPLPHHFFPRVRAAFCKRRKMLKVSLKEFYPSESIEKALEMQGLNPLSRPEELNSTHWIKLITDLELTLGAT